MRPARPGSRWGLRSLPQVRRLVPVLLLEDRRGMELLLGRLKSEPLVLRAFPIDCTNIKPGWSHVTSHRSNRSCSDCFLGIIASIQ